MDPFIKRDQKITELLTSADYYAARTCDYTEERDSLALYQFFDQKLARYTNSPDGSLALRQFKGALINPQQQDGPLSEWKKSALRRVALDFIKELEQEVAPASEAPTDTVHRARNTSKLFAEAAKISRCLLGAAETMS
ncbi:MAG: hypothetical protein GX589_04270, partial [Deltaproteobacteria bacterium]|nr:hypothetical protein [Deltaproteobacteria bacterium]